MKNTHLIIASLALPAAAFAGEYVAPAAPAPAPMAYDEPAWFFGLGADYLLDSEEMFWNGHFGKNLGAGNSVFLESGWIGQDDSYFDTDLGSTVSTELDVIPITLNYKYEMPLTERLGFYVGGGLGVSYLDVEASGLGLSADDNDWSFTAQAFAGLVFELAPSFDLYTGFRYLWIDDTDLFGANIEDVDDYSVGAGIRFKF